MMTQTKDSSRPDLMFGNERCTEIEENTIRIHRWLQVTDRDLAMV